MVKLNAEGCGVDDEARGVGVQEASHGTAGFHTAAGSVQEVCRERRCQKAARSPPHVADS